MEETIELKNVDPPIVTETVTSVTTFFENYGWYVFVILICLLYAYGKLYPYIETYFKRKDEAEYAAKYHKNPDLMSMRIIAMEQARIKLQENYNDNVEEYKIKIEEKNKRKQEELLEKYKNFPSGQKLGHTKTLKPEYNPLMGDGAGTSYRAPKKSCGSGGCGK